MRKVRVFPDADEMARATATLMAVRSARAILERGQANLALSGGSTPLAIYKALAGETLRGVMPWHGCHFFAGDERCVPLEHPESNFGQAQRALLDQMPLKPGQLHPMPVDIYQPEEAAARFQAELRTHFGGWLPVFDFILLGMGADGHTASLFGGDPVLLEEKEWVAATLPPEEARPALPRVTLTLPVINSARTVVLAVTGADKAEMVARVLGGPGMGNGHHPASLVDPQGELYWFLDAEAAAGLGN